MTACRFLLIALLLASPVATLAALEAGAAAVDITPTVEPFTDTNKNLRRDANEPFVDVNKNGKWDAVWLAGFGMGRAAQSVNDPLWARALVLRDGDTTVAIVALDLVGVLFHRVLKVKTALADLGIDHLIVSASHTHHAPDAIGIWGPRVGVTGRDTAYLDRVDAACVAAVRAAHAKLRPARLRVATCRAGDLIGDSRAPKIVDPEVLTLQLVARDGDATLATATVFGCHPEVLWSKNQVVTSDYPHYLRQRLEARLGGTALFLPGALGGLIAPRMGGHTFARCKVMGETIADRVIAALAAAPAPTEAPLRAASRRVEFPLTNLMFRVAMGASMLPKSPLMVRKPGGRILLPVDVDAVALGPVTLLGAPGELFPELGFRLKALVAGDGPVGIVGLANMELGYIVPPDVWSIRNYEETMSASRQLWPRLERSHTALLARLGRLAK